MCVPGCNILFSHSSSNLVCVYVCVNARGWQEKVSELLKPKIHVVVSHPLWVLGSELRSSVKADNTSP